MTERIVKVWVPEESMEEWQEGYNMGDPVSRYIYDNDLKIVVETLESYGLADPGDVLDIKFIKDPVISAKIEDRNFKIIELTKDTLGRVIDAEVDYLKGEVEIDRNN